MRGWYYWLRFFVYDYFGFIGMLENCVFLSEVKEIFVGRVVRMIFVIDGSVFVVML